MYDVAIIGLGAMGSAAAYHLARRGARVAGFDREHPPHALGSSHGRSRIIREAYFEHPIYVPLVQRAYQLWDELERDSGRALLVRTGGLMCGPDDGLLLEGTMRSVRAHNLPHEVLDAREIRRRFPALAPDDDWLGVLEPRAGMLDPEACVAAHLELARKAGADLQFGRELKSLAEVDAKQVVVTAGAWLPQLIPNLPMRLVVERQMLHWFEGDESCRPEHCPIALWEWEPGRLVATFPDTGDGVKVGVHHEGETTTPARVRRTTSGEEDTAVQAILRQVMPRGAGRLRESRVCLYTNTRDHHFLIDRHDGALIVSPCSGHGFKFAAAIGEVVADLVLDGGSRFDLSLFSFWNRIRSEEFDQI